MTHLLLATTTVLGALSTGLLEAQAPGWTEEPDAQGRSTVLKRSERTIDVIQGKTFSVEVNLYCWNEALPTMEGYSSVSVPHIELTVTAPIETVRFSSQIERLEPLDRYTPREYSVRINGHARNFHFAKLGTGYFSAYSLVNGSNLVEAWVQQLHESPKVEFELAGMRRTFNFTGVRAAAEYVFRSGDCYWK